MKCWISEAEESIVLLRALTLATTRSSFGQIPANSGLSRISATASPRTAKVYARIQRRIMVGFDVDLV